MRGDKAVRFRLGQDTISLLSRRASPTADARSPAWLGGFSDRPSVTESGLWNVNHVDAASRPRLLERMDYWVRRT
jgi:hypothetical protein